MNLQLTPEELSIRFSLLCRSTQVFTESASNLLNDNLSALEKIIKHDLRELARRGSPDDFADIYFALEYELARFREFCVFPLLAQKRVIGFGGAFSAGKSSLINALLGERLLVTEVDPTTSLPTYLMQGADDQISALNLFGCKINLTTDEFQSLTHDEAIKYGSNVGSLLRAAFITKPEFPWVNLALSDTPGYSKPDQAEWSERTDEQLARAQLNASQAIVWVVSAKAGGITEDDIHFLASLRQDIPRLIVISRADALPSEDVNAIVAGIKRTLADRNLPVVGVYPVSNRKKSEYSVTPILQQLAIWNTQTNELTFAKNFKKQFMRYSRFIEIEQRREHHRLNRFNRILSMNDNTDVNEDATELKSDTEINLTRFNLLDDELHVLFNTFFNVLKQIGDSVGIPLPEPSDIELVDISKFDLTSMLIEFREKQGGIEPDLGANFFPLIHPASVPVLSVLIRRRANQFEDEVKNLSELKVTDEYVASLIRRRANQFEDEVENLSESKVTDEYVASLLRRKMDKYEIHFNKLM